MTPLDPQNKHEDIFIANNYLLYRIYFIIAQLKLVQDYRRAFNKILGY